MSTTRTVTFVCDKLDIEREYQSDKADRIEAIYDVVEQFYADMRETHNFGFIANIRYTPRNVFLCQFGNPEGTFYTVDFSITID